MTESICWMTSGQYSLFSTIDITLIKVPAACLLSFRALVELWGVLCVIKLFNFDITYYLGYRLILFMSNALSLGANNIGILKPT